jgi:cold shock protein
MNTGWDRFVDLFVRSAPWPRAQSNGSMQRRALGLFNLTGAGADVFVHISAVERAGLQNLNEGQKIAYEVVADRRTGKSSADNLKPA